MCDWDRQVQQAVELASEKKSYLIRFILDEGRSGSFVKAGGSGKMVDWKKSNRQKIPQKG
jgi:hypothetical protein